MSSAAILETDRLALFPWNDDDLDDVLDLHANAQVNRFLSSVGRPWAREDARRAIDVWRHQHERFGLGKLKMIERSSGRFVGRAGFSPYGEPSVFELGFIVAPLFWGRGYASEIALALADWFFANRPERRFIAFAHPQNWASLRVISKLGVTPSGSVGVGGVDFPNFECIRE